MPAPSLLDQTVVVLHKPQDHVNIAATIRAMKNMGVGRLRLVQPVPYDPWRIEGVAHGTRDLVARITHHDTLDDALADCVWVAAFAGKRRAARWAGTTPRALAADLAVRSAQGPVALLFGQEDHGLPNEALDRAQVVCTIPTTAHASLNVAQAVMVALYELHLAAGDRTVLHAPPRKTTPPPDQAEWERYFADLERSLEGIHFFRTRHPELVMRTVRSLAYRSDPDQRELTLMRAMAIEVLRGMERVRRGQAP